MVSTRIHHNTPRGLAIITILSRSITVYLPPARADAAPPIPADACIHRLRSRPSSLHRRHMSDIDDVSMPIKSTPKVSASDLTHNIRRPFSSNESAAAYGKRSNAALTSERHDASRFSLVAFSAARLIGSHDNHAYRCSNSLPCAIFS